MLGPSAVRLEIVPLVIGSVVALVGVALVYDAWAPDNSFITRDRRRRERAERHRLGEGLVGLGTIAVAASLMGRDRWRYGTVAILVGAALLFAGALLNWRFLREMIVFSGASRRREPGEGERGAEPSDETDTPPSRTRIR